MNNRAMKAFIPAGIGLCLVVGAPAIALDRYTWTAQGSNNNWGNSVNWDDQAPGIIPDDPNEEAYFNTWTRAKANKNTPAQMAAYDAELLRMKRDGRLKALYDKYGIPYIEP